ncbi:MAG: helix-turn-helix transcriptional regulator [Polyangiaceae bacterium]|nr:helix-turn-helix transcriptional regulator [Polyangiaceae bacterium]
MPRSLDRLPDWFLGGAGKRRLLEAVVTGGSRTWTSQQLAAAARLGPKNSASRHVAVLVQAGLLTEVAGGYELEQAHPLRAPLAELLKVLRQRIPASSLPPSRGGSVRRP